MKKRCLISVYDKTGIVDFARRLHALGWEIISTGNTARALGEAGIEVVPVEEVTSFPEILDGRVKTLSPYIFGGLLYRRDDAVHCETIEKHGIGGIDMVVNTLYPFSETVANPDATEADIIEKIDIGGPSLIRAAAKNHKDVLIVTSPDQYERVLGALELGTVDAALRRRLATEAFITTAAYDVAIANWFQEKTDSKKALFRHYTNGQELRYGENPHQKAWVYDATDDPKGTFRDMRQLQGKELSYNNYNDAGFGIEAIRLFRERPTAVAIKHANPCGIASADTLLEAYNRCEAADPVSIFGGIVVLNGTVEADLAERLTGLFLEVVVAPEVTDAALEVFKKKPNLRVLVIPTLMEEPANPVVMRDIPGGVLVQERDTVLLEDTKVVTKAEPNEEQMNDLLFAWKVARLIKSNGIVIAKDECTLGIGLGEVNRYWAIQAGIERAGEQVRGAVCASDAFFPFSDSIEALAKAGVKAVIQPGGSIKDADSVRAADEAGMAMVFTGMRHFRH